MSDRVVDVSEFQPDSIDWAKVKKAGYRVIIRMGLRGSLKSNPARYKKICYDKHYEAYLDGVVKAGCLYTMYFFPTSITDEEADQEAQWIIMNLGGKALDMPFYLDSENVYGSYSDPGRANSLSVEQRTRLLKRITDRLVEAGIPCGIYASTSWLNKKIDMSQLQEQVVDNTWVAQYNTKCTYDSRYVMWQYTSKGSVDGISGNVDISVITGEFNMSCQRKTEKPADKDVTRIMTFPVTDPVKISNSGCDENGNYHGGTAGDNSGREWYIREWYNRPWNCVLRHPDPEVRACLADLAIKAANNNKIGYDQYQRQTYWQQLQQAGYDPSKITVACEADCSAGVIANVKAAGHILGRKELQDITCTYTGNMRSGLKAAGFECLTASKYLSGSSYLVAGDILLNDEHHTATAVTNGTKSGQAASVEKKEEYDMPEIKNGSQGKAVKILQIILGGVTVDGDFGWKTMNAVIEFQKAHGLSADGIVGPKTWAELLSTL